MQAFFHLILNNSYWPLISAIPLSLANQTQAPAIPGTQDAKRPGEVYIDDNAVGGPDDNPSTYEDFAHPAAVEPQQVVWIPRDTLGLCGVEEREDRAHAVEVSTQGARMDAKGHVDIDGPPPGEDVRV